MTDTVRGNKASELRTQRPRTRANLCPHQISARPAKDREGKSESETVSETRPRSTSSTPLQTRSRLPSLTRQNWMNTLRMEHKNLEQMQKDFMNKIRTMAEQGKKLPGTFKFVSMVCNENRQLVEDTPADSVCRDNDKRLTDELAKRDETISELEQKLQALKLDASQDKDYAVKSLEAEEVETFKRMQVLFNVFDRMCSRLEETDIKLMAATEHVKKHAESMTNMNELRNQIKASDDIELARLREQLDANNQLLAARSFTIMKLQQNELKLKEKYGNIFQELSQKNTLVTLLNNELDAKNEQVGQVLKALNEKQDTVARQQNTIRLLEEQTSRSALMRTKHEERIASLLLEISQLKEVLNNHAHVMAANIEDMQALRTPHQPLPQPEQ